MRVIHLLDSLNRGGVEMLALDVCRNARAGGLDLTLVATGGGDLEDDFRRSGADFVRLRRRLPVDPSVVFRLRRIIKRRRARVVHTYQAVEGLHAYLAARGTDARVVLSFHGYAPDAKNRAALKFLVPRVHANVAVSRDFLSSLKSVEGLDTGRNFHVVYDAVDAKRVRAAAPSLRAELGLGDGELLLGMVANFYPDGRKDQMTVCRALPALFGRVPGARFAFVGGHEPSAPRPFEECVEFCRRQGISGRVHFLGKRADIAEVLSSLDVFVFSSLRDTFGVAVVEAMLAGVPCVVSDIGPLVEVSGEGRYAALFRTGDREDLARRLVELSEDRETRLALGAAGREWAARQFSIEAHVAALRELYGGLAAA